MKVTLRDIADEVNVSVSTVSRALNDQVNVDTATRTRVQRTAKKLGYPLDNLKLARNARTFLLLRRLKATTKNGGTGTLSRDDVLILGAQETFDKEGLATRVHQVTQQLDEASLADANLAGAILLGGMIHPEVVKQLQKADVPFVIAGAGIKSVEANYVSADYSAGTEEAVAYLASHKRKHIGFVNGSASTLSSEEKLKGFRLGLLNHNLAYTAKQVVESDFDADEGYRKTLELLKQNPKLDAIIFAADDIAMGGVHALKELGKSIPKDIAVIGYYDHGLARFIDPPLSSIAVDLRQIGRVAAERLLMLVGNPETDPWRIIMPTSLVIRSSA